MPNFKYKAIIFDYDDTLVESRKQKWDQHKHVAKKFYNIDITDGDLGEHWGKPLHLLVEGLYKLSDTVENIYTNLALTRDDFRKVVYEGSVDLVKRLLKDNIKIGVVSATARRFLIDDLKDHGFPLEDFIIVQGADDTLVHKPDPAVFTPVLEKLSKEGIKKEEITYVGDSITDLEAAHKAGISFVAITTGLYSEEDFKKLGAKTII
ncbi:MAG TPA: HAD-IA family hydrolase [Candidatus Paceibacterota bacterium]